MTFIKYAIFLLSAVIALSKPFNPKKVIYAVDCGSLKPTKSAQGFTYQADNGYSPNTRISDYTLNSEVAAATIKYTKDQEQYMTERHADETFWYDLPVTNPGKYVVISKFSENWLRTPKTRMFNINIGDCLGEEKVDIFDKSGGRFSAYDSYVEFELRDGRIYVKGRECYGAYVNKRVRVNYAKIGFDNPKVDAIVLYEGDLSETDYAEQPEFRRDWERKMKEEARVKEEEKIRKEEARMKRREKNKERNDAFEDFGDDYETRDYGNASGKSLIDSLGDYAGLAFLMALGGAVIYFVRGERVFNSIESIFGGQVPESRSYREPKEPKEKKEKKESKGAATKTTTKKK